MGAVWELFNAVREMPEEQRSTLLENESLDPGIRDDVRAVLDASSSCAASFSTFPSPAAGPEYAPGREFGRYVMISTIGQGGFGRIYAAHDKELRRIVAVKVLSSRRLDSEQRLIDEARSASGLNHPNIITVYETIAIEDQLAIVMEFVDGQSLRQILRKTAGPLPVESVVSYGKQVAEALAAAHATGIVHRDVKPENVLVRKDGYVKLVDFGLATDATAVAVEAEPLGGTLRYLAPERLRGESSSAASDVFSLGLMMYEMAAGVHPFPGGTPLAVAQAIVSDHAAPLSHKDGRVPPELNRVVTAMLSREPGSRPSAASVAAGLEQVGKGGGRLWNRSIPILLALAVLATALTYMLAQWARKPPALALRLDTRPLSGEVGLEINPALSPDGLSIVYSWQASPAAAPITYLRQIHSDRKHTLPIPSPYSWLPDSRRIGFVRRGKDLDTLCTIAREGTGEREVLRAKEIANFEWSPDGKSIIYAATPNGSGNSAIFRFQISSGESSQITFPPATSLGDEHFAISPDGQQLAFRRSSNFGNSDVFLMTLAAPGKARQVTSYEVNGEDMAWTRDAKALVLSNFRGSNFSLWLHTLTGLSQSATRLTEPGMEAVNIRSARNQNRLTWVSRMNDTNIWRVPVTGGKPVRTIASTMRDNDIASSSLGLLAFRSDRSGFPEIWIGSGDGGSQKAVTKLESFTGSPQWSPDGRRLVFGSRRRNTDQDVYVMDCDPAQMICTPPVQVTDHAATDTVPNWSADGTWIYYASQRSGNWQIWRTASRSNGAEAMQMTTDGGYFAAESPDGAWLYYSRIDSAQSMGVWRKPLRPVFRAADPGELVLPLQFLATATWVLTDREIFYSTPGRGYFEPGEPLPMGCGHLILKRAGVAWCTGPKMFRWPGPCAFGRQEVAVFCKA